MPLQTPHLDLEARRWQAAVDAVNLRNDLTAEVRRAPSGDNALVTVRMRTATDESIALWETLMEPGQAATEFDLLCETAEWQEMIAQGVG